MSDLNRYYEILGASPDDSIDEIKQCYRDLVNIWHPDRFSNNPRLQRKAQEKLKEINIAYKKICSFVIEYNKRTCEANYSHEAKTDYEKESEKGSEKKEKSHVSEEQYYANALSTIINLTKEYWGIIFILIIIGGSYLFSNNKKENYSQKSPPISEYNKLLPKEYKVTSPYLLPNNQQLSFDKDSNFPKKPLPSANIPLEPINPKSLRLGSSPFGIGIRNGNSMITVDNGTTNDALVKLIKYGHKEEKIRNFYIPAGKKYTANKIPQGQYVLRIAFGKDWDGKMRRFNFNRHFSETELFYITESKWNESTDEGIMEKIRFSKMNCEWTCNREPLAAT
jgi:curved DNA-binding protein CbpA